MELPMAKKEEPKVVDVRVSDNPGALLNKKNATVTLDNGISRTAAGVNTADAIERASSKAQESAWWSRKLFGD
jgi:hypothetical protein